VILRPRIYAQVAVAAASAADGAAAASNADALRSGLAWMMILPWVLCFLSFSALHWVYPKDRDALLAATKVKFTGLTQNSQVDPAVSLKIPI
jgi:hypothetical protein